MTTSTNEMNAARGKVIAASDDGYKYHLIKELLFQNPDFKHEVDNVVPNHIGSHATYKTKIKSLDDAMNNPVFFPPMEQPRFIDEQTLVLPFSRGTNYHREGAIELPDNESELFKKVTYVDLDNGEINMALVQGQLLSAVYPNTASSVPASNYGNGTCGSLTKFMTLANPYSFNVLIKSITRIWMPSNRDAVFMADPGTLQLSSVGVHGKTLNTFSYKIGDTWFSNTSNRVFLDVNKTSGGTMNDFFQHDYIQENRIVLPAGVTKFNFNVLAQIATSTSFDFSKTEGLDETNYGLAFIDLRSRLQSGRDPILSRPFIGGFKSAPGGIRVHTTFEFYEL